jgi:hypothetical protein
VQPELRVQSRGRATTPRARWLRPTIRVARTCRHLSKLPMYTTFGGGGGLTKAFNRLELTAKGDVERTVYQDSLLT